MKDNLIDRRKFFKMSLLAGVATSGVAAGILSGCSSENKEQNSSVNASTETAPAQTENAHAHNHDAAEQTQAATNEDSAKRGRMFIQLDTLFATLSAACERIYPKDESSPGAIDLKVPYFIDNQLAGAYGYNAREYMQGPFFEGIPEQGYQSPLYRRDIFLIGLEGLNNTANAKFKKNFGELEGAQQDEILKEFEAGKAEVEGISSKYFFTLLREMTLAGALSDPIYQGNKNMDGWRAMDYPGAQMGYLAQIEGDEFYKAEPMGLADMQ